MSHGADETERLKTNIQDQLSRLLQQLQDLEDLRAELDDDEYNETRADSIEQIREFEQELQRLMDGDMSLVSSLGQVKLAIRAAISNSFQSADVIRSFARREPAALRAQLKVLQQEYRTKHLTEQQFKTGAVEVLVALQRLGEELSPEEKSVLDSASGELRRRFEAADESIGEAAVLSMARQKA